MSVLELRDVHRIHGGGETAVYAGGGEAPIYPDEAPPEEYEVASSRRWGGKDCWRKAL